MTEATDAAVVERVLSGDAEAFAVLVDRYYDRYTRYAVHLVGNREDAEEALQDAFLRAYRHLGSYEERERFASWLLRIVVNQCRTAAARHRRREHTFPDVDPAELELAAGSDGEGAERHELRDRLERALSRLPADQREAVARARAYVHAAIAAAPGIGQGHGPLDHAVTLDPARLKALAS